MEQLLTIIMTVCSSVAASGGFWAFMQKKSDNADAKTQMLVGLGHDRIVHLGTVYIQRGSITHDEYETLHDYLYVPYLELGGNGLAKRIIDEVEKLPFSDN
jgi:hypothetical protein